MMNKAWKAIAAIMLVMVVAVSCKEPAEPNNGNNSVKPEYVDLGLPSGTLWATFNVGATMPEEAGYYFAWGETQNKNNFGWNNYKYCVDGDTAKLTKYCNMPIYGNNGFVDNLVTLASSDDAATIQWGSDWCTPTYTQWRELNALCHHEWTVLNLVNGRRFTGPNGNSIFLPAVGLQDTSDTTNTGSFGDYWTSSLSTSIQPLTVQTPKTAFGYRFVGMHTSVESFERCCGLSIRPVRSKK